MMTLISYRMSRRHRLIAQILTANITAEKLPSRWLLGLHGALLGGGRLRQDRAKSDEVDDSSSARCGLA